MKAMLVVPALPSSGGGTRNVGLAGSAPPALAATIAEQAHAVGITARVTTTPVSPPASRPSAKAAPTCSWPARSGWSGQARPTSSSRPS